MCLQQILYESFSYLNNYRLNFSFLVGLMMARRGVIGGFLLILLCSSLIIIIPISSISITFLSYGLIEERFSYSYNPSTPYPIEQLYINADVGNIDIRYVDPPVDYHASIDVNIVMSGKDLAGNSYKDYINISWSDSGSSANITIEVISDEWNNPSLWIIQKVDIIVNLRKDILFDITAITLKGDSTILVPFGVAVNDIDFNVSNGDILYNFDQCILEGNISAYVGEGELNLKSYNLECAQDINWVFNNDDGDMNIEVFQYKEMNANITGIVSIYEGNLYFTYRDNTPNVGANFTLPLSLPDRDGVIYNRTGFIIDYPLSGGYFLESLDYPSKSHYDLFFMVIDNDYIDIVSFPY